jgi:hypothetical protein
MAAGALLTPPNGKYSDLCGAGNNGRYATQENEKKLAA